MNDSAEADLNEFLFRTGLLKRGEIACWTKLSGGVSSDIWKVELPDQTICVKRALARLKVKADWQAPTVRNIYEWKWFNFVHRNFPGIVPRPVAHDAEMQMLAMEYLDPEDFKLWKTELLKGETDSGFASKTGASLARIHARSAFDGDLARSFAADEIFFALRIEAYLLATAEKHRRVAPQIREIATRTFNAKIALVHGDVSPKNILIGKENPVFLDAETAWFGDPAFDLAFCLNHFLLKAAYQPQFASGYKNCFEAFAEGYLSRVDWEPREEIAKRTARLLPVLYLARVDGKSPVEYITEEHVKNEIRRRALALIENPESRLPEILESVRSSDPP
jgi:5-methylthioribose kinase